ncbi:MAG: hypothetical protein R3F55_25625 [Alphaproteobacteria bacterium]
MTRMVSATAALAAALLLAFSADESQAVGRRTAGSTADQCFADAAYGNASSGSGGALTWCCYANGCWICNNVIANPNLDKDCAWDPAYSSRHLPAADRITNQLQQSPGDVPATVAPLGNQTTQ